MVTSSWTTRLGRAGASTVLAVVTSMDDADAIADQLAGPGHSVLVCMPHDVSAVLGCVQIDVLLLPDDIPAMERARIVAFYGSTRKPGELIMASASEFRSRLVAILGSRAM